MSETLTLEEIERLERYAHDLEHLDESERYAEGHSYDVTRDIRRACAIAIGKGEVK